MEAKIFKAWLNTDFQHLLALARYNRSYMYLPAPIGENSQQAYTALCPLFEILSVLPYQQSNVFILRYILMFSWNRTNEITSLSFHQNQKLLETTLSTIMNDLKINFSSEYLK